LSTGKGIRYNKRLWAALRDWIKPGSQFEPIFINSLDTVEYSQLSQYLKINRSEALSSLELPGDVWNLRFFKNLFGDELKSSQDLRKRYNELLSQGVLPNSFFPEQFDISVSYAENVCEARYEALCLFKNGPMLKKFCIAYSHGETQEMACPIKKILCGYDTACKSLGCPVAEDRLRDICPGCSIKIE